MRNFMYAAKAIFVTLLLCCSGLAYADGKCPPGGTGTAECPQTIDTIEVTGGGGGGGGGGYEQGGCGSACNTDTGGGTGGGGGGTSISEETQAKIINVIKASKDLCKKSSEDCGAWGARMTNPAPLGSGFCPNISAVLPVIGQALCNQAISFETGLHGCANVGCP